ncbi:MAG: alpha/beta fold hydrolase [bacterium]|nr:alpha/beta fold hydrolase [bacterium]
MPKKANEFKPAHSAARQPPPPGGLPAFRPAWFCPGAHLQTLWGVFLRRFPDLDWRRERWDTPDGDFLLIDILDPPRAQAPTLFVLHGLEGSSDSHYVKGIARAARAEGWRVAAMNFRSCGGEANRLPRLYHSADTGDLEMVLERALGRFEGPIFLAGFSIGGNVLLKWLAARGESVPAPVRAAAALSPSFDPGASGRHMDQNPWSLYRWELLRLLKRKGLAFSERFPGLVDAGQIRASRTFAEFDRCVTARVHGFADENDYYARARSAGELDKIRVPTLLVSAADDPVVPAAAYPQEAIDSSAWLRGVMLPSGGHVGFVAGRNPFSAEFWAEDAAIGFFRELIEDAG